PRLLTAAGQDLLSIGTETQSGDRGGVREERALESAERQFPNPHRPLRPGNDQGPAVRTKSAASREAVLRQRVTHRLTGIDIPQTEKTAPRRDDPLAVGVKADMQDRAEMAEDRTARFSGRTVQELGSTVRAAIEDLRPVWTESDGGDRARLRDRRVDGLYRNMFRRIDMPKANLPRLFTRVAAAGDDRLAVRA